MAEGTSLPEPIPASVATAERYRHALLSIRNSLTDNMHKMLGFQYCAPGWAATATELAAAAGYATYHPANRQYGELAKLVAEALHFTPPRRADGTHRYWTTLSTGDPEQEASEHFRFVMRPELAEALAGLGWYRRPAAGATS
jgi:hypothetical protein